MGKKVYELVYFWFITIVRLRHQYVGTGGCLTASQSDSEGSCPVSTHAMFRTHA